MKTTMLVTAAFVTALVAISVVPTASADDGTTDGTSPCNGLVDVTCDDNGNACVLWVDHDSPGVPKCLVGG